METRACVLYAQEDVRVETREVGEVGPQQVLIRIGAGGICGSDIHYYWDGGIGTIRVTEPIVMGHEVAGTVEAVGELVRRVRPGDRVAVSPSRPCGKCKFCLAGEQQHCLEMQFFGSAMRKPHTHGGFRDRLVAEEYQCEPIGNDVSLGEAACAEPLAVAAVVDVACHGAPVQVAPAARERVAASRALIERLADGFKASYDSEGYKQTAAYAGVGAMLTGLRAAGLQLSIATNKRILPTRLILDHLGWLDHFEHLYALDLFEPRLPHKAAMIARLLADKEIPRDASIYIGDRSEDGESADANALPFIAATWGYGSIEPAAMAHHWRSARTPTELAEAILAD